MCMLLAVQEVSSTSSTATAILRRESISPADSHKTTGTVVQTCTTKGFWETLGRNWMRLRDCTTVGHVASHLFCSMISKSGTVVILCWWIFSWIHFTASFAKAFAYWLVQKLSQRNCFGDFAHILDLISHLFTFQVIVCPTERTVMHPSLWRDCDVLHPLMGLWVDASLILIGLCCIAYSTIIINSVLLQSLTLHSRGVNSVAAGGGG